MLGAPAKLVYEKRDHWICPQKPFSFTDEFLCSGVLSIQNYSICYKWHTDYCTIMKKDFACAMGLLLNIF